MERLHLQNYSPKNSKISLQIPTKSLKRRTNQHRDPNKMIHICFHRFILICIS
jgi:hypothetical protein